MRTLKFLTLSCLFLIPLKSHAVTINGKDYDTIWNPFGGHLQYTTSLSTNAVVGTGGITVTTTTHGVSIAGSGGGGGGSSTLAIGTGTASSFVKIITSPTANISVLPSQFNLTTSGTTSFWQLNGSSVTLLGPKIGLTNEVEGILPIANGGLSSSTASGGLSNLLTSLTFTPPSNLNLDYMSYYDSGVAQTYATSLQQMADLILPTFSGIWDLSQGGTGFDNAVDAMGNFISSLGVPAFPSDGSISYFPYYNSFEGVAHSVTADSLASFVGSSLSNQFVRISTNGTVQSGAFTIAGGTFSSANNESVHIIRTSAAGSIQNVLGFYTDSGGGPTLRNQFGFTNTNGNGFSLLDSGGLYQWRLVKKSIPTRMEMQIFNASGANYVAFRSSDSLAADITLILPNTKGTAGQVLTVNDTQAASGGDEAQSRLTWTTPSAGGGGSSTLAVSSNNVIVSSPTGNLNFMPPFIVALQGSTSAQVTLNSSSVTLQGVINPIYNQPTLQSGATAYPSFVYVGSSATIAGDLAIGTLASASVAAPRYIDLGGTYSSSAGSNPKLKLYNDGVSIVGLGISSSQMDYIIPSAFSHDWYIGGTQKMALDTNGITVLGNGQFGTNTGVGTATPLNVSFGGTYGNSTAGSTANLKWLMYYNTGDGNKYGIGMSSGLMEYQAGTIGGHGFYVDAGTLAMYINGGAGGTKGYIAMNATNNAAAKLHIQPAAATDIATIIQGASSQSANLLELRNNSSVILSTFNSSGELQLPKVTASTVTIAGGSSNPASLQVNTGDGSRKAVSIQDASGQSAVAFEYIRSDNQKMLEMGRGPGGEGMINFYDTTGANPCKFYGSASAITIDSAQTAKFRLLPFVNDIYFQNTNTSGDIYFTGSSGATLTGTARIVANTVNLGAAGAATTFNVNGSVGVTTINEGAISTTRSGGVHFSGNINLDSGFYANSPVKTTSYVMTSTDSIIMASGTITVTLPSAANGGQQITVLKVNKSTAAVILQAVSGQLIAGTSDQFRLYAPGQSAELIADGGVNWFPKNAMPVTPAFVGTNADPNSAAIVTASTTYCNSITVPNYMGITGIRLDVGAQAKLTQAAIYDANGSVISTSTLQTIGTGALTIPFVNVAYVNPGVNWICFGSESATTSVTRQAASTSMQGNCSFATSLPFGLTKTFTGCTPSANFYAITGLVGGGT